MKTKLNDGVLNTSEIAEISPAYDQGIQAIYQDSNSKLQLLHANGPALHSGKVIGTDAAHADKAHDTGVGVPGGDAPPATGQAFNPNAPLQAGDRFADQWYLRN